ncbi:MAG: T9SS type A sorting domain-containing protein [Saprospiraceae bacterium]|nr:T9SS type A sorting domain-containing protein [Saprospiraceae bacterium]
MKTMINTKAWMIVLFALLTASTTGFGFSGRGFLAPTAENSIAGQENCSANEGQLKALIPNCTVTVTPATPSTVSIGGDQIDFTVKADSSWSVSWLGSWISIQNWSGSGDGSFTVTVDPNCGGSRSATLTITTNCAASQTITISQEGSTFVAIPGTQNVTGLAGSTTFNITSNSAWSASSNVPWITITSPSGGAGTGDGTLNVSYTYNNTGQARTGTIDVSTCLGSATLTVVQDCYVCLSVQSYVGYLCVPEELNVFSNADWWTATENFPWMSVYPASGSNNGTITVAATPNEGCSARVGTITFTASKDGYIISQSVQINQSPICLVVTPTNQNVGSSAGMTSFNISTDGVAWTASTAASWITLSPTYGPPSGIFPGTNATYAANNSNSTRVGYIYITSCGATQVVTVTQAGVPELCSNDFEPANNSRGTAPALIIPSTKYSQIGYSSDNDFWKFTVGSIGNIIGLTLTNLPANYDLYVTDSRGKILDSSTNLGIADEYINVTLEPGTYFAYVKGFEGAYSTTQCYTLSLFLDAFQGGAVDRDFQKITPIDDLSSENLDFELYPNPASGLTQVVLQNDEPVELQVLNQLGQVVFTTTGSARLEWDASGLPNGLYSVRVQTEHRSVVKQLLVNH